MVDAVRAEIRGLQGWLSEVRRDFHRYPELKFEERRTARVVAEHLRSWGLEVREGVADTGVVGLLKGKAGGPILGIRADMDALPIQEVEGRSYGSQNEGVMHACGHDAHMAMALGAARYLSQRRSTLSGGIKFLFQPAEEGGGGGLRMVEAGVLEEPRVDRLVALHVWPELPKGSIGVTPGPCQAAADGLVIKVRGKGGHSAYPHRTSDPIVAASALVLSLQGVVSRQIDPLKPLVISICRFQAGTTFNVIPEEAELLGTIRTLSEGVRTQAHDAIQRMAKGIGESYRVSVEAQIIEGYPVLVNDPQCSSFALEVARSLVGEDRVSKPPPSMGSEDFSFMLQRCPGVFVRLGCGEEGETTPEIHSPEFDLDEAILPLGVEFLVRFAEAFLGESGGDHTSD